MGSDFGISSENPLSNNDISALYSIKGAVLGLSQAVVLIALVIGCHTCYRKRLHRHKRRGRRLHTSAEESKDNDSSNTTVPPQAQSCLDPRGVPIVCQAPGPGAFGMHNGNYGSVVQSGTYVMDVPNMDIKSFAAGMPTAAYAPSAPYIPGVPETANAWPQQPSVPPAHPEDLPPAYSTVFPEKKS